MDEPLVDATDLDAFPGGPFTPEQVDAAGGQLRAECGWHIAPTVTETLTVDADGGPLLFLPTLHLLEVTEVRDVTGDTPRVVTGWRKSRSGMLRLHGRWPHDYEAVEVDVVHGFERCPDALLPILAERCQQFGKDGSVRQESLGSRSVSYGNPEGSRSGSVLARFRIP